MMENDQLGDCTCAAAKAARPGLRNLPWKRKGNREGHDVQSRRKTQEKEQRFSA